MRIFVTLLLVVFLTSIASAEVLVTADPLGQGRWGFLGGAIYDMNLMDNSDYNMTTFGGYIGYGILEMLDAYLQLGYGTVSGLPTGMDQSGTAYGLNLKYTVLQEGADMPVSVAIGAGYKAVQTKSKMSPPLVPIEVETTTDGSQIMVGVGVSKVMPPFVPYGGLTYRSNSADSTAVSTQIDGTIGTAIAWSPQGAVFIEYTMQSITPDGGTAYTSNQIAGGVGYSIP